MQTLRVTTANPDDTQYPNGHVGHLFRVILETDLLNEDGSARGATSEAVTITPSDEFSVVLDYIPPLAGDIATFTSHLNNTDGIDLNKLTYTWEANMGDGWVVIPGSANSPTWSTPTNAVEESASSNAGDNAEPVVMTYIRVRVTTSEGKTATSNTQPLTVRVGESDGAQKTEEINSALNEPAAASTKKTDGDSDKSNGKSKKKRKITEVSAPVVEETRGSMAEYLDDSRTPTDPSVSGDFTEIVINKDVSDKIAEQQEAAKEQKESKTPGAKWTELNTITPKQEDVQRIFADNPFAPLAVPMGLGIIVAGGLEKLLAFRRQL